MAQTNERVVNFDENEEEESFLFQIKGVTFRFKHLTGEEVKRFYKLQNEDDAFNKIPENIKAGKTQNKAEEFFNEYISKEDKEGPSLDELMDKMLLPTRTRFYKKLLNEMTGNAAI